MRPAYPAERRNGTGCPPRSWQERPAVQRTIPADVQQGTVPDGLRADLRQPRRDDARGQLRDRGRHVRGEDRRHHRGDAPRALPVLSRPPGVHPEKERETPATGPAIMVGQTRRRSGAPPAGSLLRADVLRPLTRIPARAGLPYRPPGNTANLTRDLALPPGSLHGTL